MSASRAESKRPLCLWCRERRSVNGEALCQRCATIRGPVRVLRERALRRDGWQWDGKSYGLGPGMAHPAVRVVRCAQCNARPGELCTGPHGPKFSTHYLRRRAHAAGRMNNLAAAGRLRSIRVA
jgi:hypothetical protein